MHFPEFEQIICAEMVLLKEGRSKESCFLNIALFYEKGFKSHGQQPNSMEKKKVMNVLRKNVHTENF